MADHNSNRMREEWQSQAFRSKIVSKLDDQMKKNQTVMPKSSVEMEEYVFQKAGSREEYLDLVARVLLSVSGDRRMQGQSQNPNAVPAQGSQDSIGALQNLTGQVASGMERQVRKKKQPTTTPLTTSERLIKAVEKRPVLYDKDTLNYSNRTFVLREWRKVAKEAGTDLVTAKKRWKQMRDYFQKQRNEFHKNPATKAFSKKRWYMYDSMQFLIPHLNPKRLSIDYLAMGQEGEDYDEVELDGSDDDGNNINSSQFSATDQNEIGNDDDDENDDDDDDMAELSDERQEVNDDDDYVDNFDDLTKRTKSNSLDTNFNFTSEVVRSLNGIADSLRISNEAMKDEDECFFRSLIPRMKMLDPVTKLKCQGEIHQIVLKYMKQTSLMMFLDDDADKFQSETSTAASRHSSVLDGNDDAKPCTSRDNY